MYVLDVKTFINRLTLISVTSPTNPKLKPLTVHSIRISFFHKSPILSNKELKVNTPQWKLVIIIEKENYNITP